MSRKIKQIKTAWKNYLKRYKDRATDDQLVAFDMMQQVGLGPPSQIILPPSAKEKKLSRTRYVLRWKWNSKYLNKKTWKDSPLEAFLYKHERAAKERVQTLNAYFFYEHFYDYKFYNYKQMNSSEASNLASFIPPDITADLRTPEWYEEKGAQLRAAQVNGQDKQIFLSRYGLEVVEVELKETDANE